MAERDAASTEAILDRYWDAVLAGEPGAIDRDLDPVLAATVRRVHALDAKPIPSSQFSAKLWEVLVHTQVDVTSPLLDFSPPSRLYSEPLVVAPSHRIGRQAPTIFSRLAAAVILVALIAASAYAALYPLGMLDRNALTLFAPADNPSAETDDRIGDVLLSLTLSDLPPMRTFGGLTVTDYPAGASSQERTRRGPQLWYVAIGPMTLNVTEASKPVRVIAPGSTELTSADALLSTGNETEVAAGSTVVAPSGSVIELLNSGSEPARMLALLAADASDSDGTLRDGATWRWGSVGMPQEIAPPVHFDLRQVTINPSAALPIPPPEKGDYSAAVLDGQRVRDLSFAADLGWRNTSFAPLETYLLRITSAATAQE